MKNKLVGMDLINYVSDEAINIPLMGPFGRACYVIQELMACAGRSDVIGMREQEKKDLALSLCNGIKVALSEAQRSATLYKELKAERRGQSLSLAELQKEKLTSSTQGGKSAPTFGLKRTLGLSGAGGAEVAPKRQMTAGSGWAPRFAGHGRMPGYQNVPGYGQAPTHENAWGLSSGGGLASLSQMSPTLSAGSMRVSAFGGPCNISVATMDSRDPSNVQSFASDERTLVGDDTSGGELPEYTVDDDMQLIKETTRKD